MTSGMTGGTMGGGMTGGAPSAGPALRIAVVGAGLAGLTAAWRLAQRGHRVTLFEKHAAPGLVAHSLAVPLQGPTLGPTPRQIPGSIQGQQLGPGAAPEASTVRVDVPLRVFYAGYYPTLTRLYRELGIATEAVSYASSFHEGGSAGLYFRYRNWLTGGRSFSWVAPQDLLGARARRIVAGALRFRRQAPRALAAGALAGVSLGDYVKAEGYDEVFVHGLLLPAIATVCTCPYDDGLRFPATVIVDYLTRGLTREPVRRVVHGADEVARRLCAGISEVRLSLVTLGARRAPAAGLEGAGPPTRVALRLADGCMAHFHHLVLATQAHQALALLDDASAEERRALGGFSYRPVEVVMHRDRRLLPARQRDWSAVNLLVNADDAQPQSTIWVNAVQPALAGAAPVFQTVHPLITPREEAVLAHARFERPVVTAASEQALAGLAVLHAQPGRCVWFCGAYAQAGIPLLESAVCSAEAVVHAIGAEVGAVVGAASPSNAATRP